MKRIIFTLLVIISGIASFGSFLMILNFPPFDIATAGWGLKLLWLGFSLAIMIGIQYTFNLLLTEIQKEL